MTKDIQQALAAQNRGREASLFLMFLRVKRRKISIRRLIKPDLGVLPLPILNDSWNIRGIGNVDSQC